MVQGGMSVVKYLLFAFNFIFVVTGAALIAVGAWVQAKAAEYVDFLGDKYASAPILLIVVGVIIFILSFMGCCGAIKENYCMVMTFAVLLFIIFILELAAGILAYVYKSEVETVIRHNMKNAMKNYNTSDHDIVTRTWDDMQSNLKCCGANNASEWKEYLGDKLPYSCCPGKDIEKECKKDHYKKIQICVDNFVQGIDHVISDGTWGCIDALANFLEDKILVVGGVGIGIAFVQIIGIIFSCCLARAIKKEYEVV